MISAACILTYYMRAQARPGVSLYILLLYTVSVVILYTTLPLLLYYFITLLYVRRTYIFCTTESCHQSKERALQFKNHYGALFLFSVFYFIFLFLSKNLKVKVPTTLCLHSRANTVCLRVWV